MTLRQAGFARRSTCFRWVTKIGAAAGVLVAVVASDAAEPPVAHLARDGRALMPVRVAEGASQRVRAAADTLAEYLGRISGVAFEVGVGDGTGGVAVGVVSDFPALSLTGAFDAEGAARSEQYLLRSHSAGLYVIGATDLAVEHAVWDLLYRLGHRQFFPAPEWEVVPERADLAIAIDANESPDYLHRRIWYTYGSWPENRAALAAWSARNRVVSAFDLNTGHAYGSIIRANQAAFDAHPEYYALVDGERKIDPQAKLCISNPAVRQLAIDYALAFFERNPDSQTVSVEPSDGGGWCECEPCAAIGTPSDLALTLANAVAEALADKYPGQNKFVAMYAYNQHSEPPSIRAHPRVIINAATAFIRGGRTIDQIIQGWSNQGVQQFGIREYYSVIHWDKDLPGGGRGAKLDYLARTIPHFYSMGARFLTAESSENWGPNGLGYYLASRMLWDVTEAQRIDELIDDFLDKAFGDAREPMAEFYEILNGDHAVQLSDHLIGKMYRLLDDASHRTSDPRIQARLHHLVLYARYLELYHRYQQATGEARQAAFEDVIRHSYRIRNTGMVHSLAHYRTKFRDESVQVPDEAHWKKPEAINPWKTSDPFTESEIRAIIEEGIANHPLRAFDPIHFSRDIRPADALRLVGKPFNKDRTHTGRGVWYFYTWIDDASRAIELQVTGGLIAHYRDRGPAKVQLQAWDEEEADYLTVDQAETLPDGTTRALRLTPKSAGRHRVVLSDGMDKTSLRWPAGLPWTIESSLDHANPHRSGRASYYFYVPKGTQVVGGFAPDSLVGSMYDAQGRKVLSFEGNDAVHGFVHVPVPPGQDGKLWSLRNMSGGSFQLMTTPPYLASSPAELMLPAEVIDRDRE